MSGKKDPFNFDDIYAATGNNNFIKKPMGELKKQPAPNSSISSDGRGPSVASTLAPAKPRHAPAPVAVKASDLDFLGTPATKAAAPAAPAPASHSNGLGMDDLFGHVAAAPAVPSKPAPAPVQAAAGGSDPFDVFGDVHGAEAAIPAAPTSTSAVAADDHWEAFTGAGGAPSPIQSTPPPPPATQASPLPVFDAAFPDSFPAHTTPAAPTHTSHAAAKSASSTSSAYESSAHMRPATSYSVHQSASSSGRDGYTHAEQQAHSGRGTHYWSGDGHPGDGPYQPSDGGFSADGRGQRKVGSSGGSGGGSTSGGGMVGLLKGFGKKAVKAAKEGLQHLESALERMDQQGAGQQAQPASQPVRRDGYARDAGAEGYGYVGSAGGGRSSGEDEPRRVQHQHQGEDPRTVAITLMALPVEERREVLATLPPGQRARVAEALAELEGPAAGGRASVQAAGRPVPALAVDVRTSAVDISAFDAPLPSALPPAPPPPPPPPVPTTRPGSGGVPLEPGWGRAQQAPAAAAQQQAATAEHHDLLGFGASHGPPAPTPPVAAVDDLLGFVGAPATPAAPVPTHTQPVAAFDVPFAAAAAAAPAPAAPQPFAAAQPAARTQDVDDLHDFFGGGSGAPSAAPTPAPMSHANSVHDLFGTGAAARTSAGANASSAAPTRGAAAAMDMLGGLHADVDVDVTAHQDLYEDNEGTVGEPEERRRLRAARLAEKHAKMKAALAEKIAREEEEARRRAEQVELKEGFKANVDVWKNKNKGNIRGLLASLQSVLWEGSGWTPVGMGDLLEPAQIRKVWMRANLLVHPDKVRQRNGSAEQVAIADMIFDVIKDAWNTFQSAGK